MGVLWDKLATELAPDLCSTGKIDQIKIQFYFSVSVNAVQCWKNGLAIGTRKQPMGH